MYNLSASIQVLEQYIELTEASGSSWRQPKAVQKNAGSSQQYNPSWWHNENIR